MRLFLIVSTMLFLAGCYDQDAASTYEVEVLRGRINELQNRISNLEFAVNDLRERTSQNNNAAFLSPADSGYSIVQTSNGPLYISLQDVKKYADGHKIKLKIGNPNFASLPNVKLNIEYNKAFSDKIPFSEWSSDIKKTEYKIKTPLAAGSWSLVEIVLSPSTEAETGFIKVQPQVDEVILRPVGLIE